jgi:hypothetical protein
MPLLGAKKINSNLLLIFHEKIILKHIFKALVKDLLMYLLG